MPTTRYYLTGDYSNIVLQCDSADALEATALAIENVTTTNLARAELHDQLSRMAQSQQESLDCKIEERKYAYLRRVMLRLFDAGKAEIIIGNRSYSSAAVKKEHWSDEKIPGHSKGGYGGFLYRASDGQVVFKQATWIS